MDLNMSPSISHGHKRLPEELKFPDGNGNGNSNDNGNGSYRCASTTNDDHGHDEGKDNIDYDNDNGEPKRKSSRHGLSSSDSHSHSSNDCMSMKMTIENENENENNNMNGNSHNDVEKDRVREPNSSDGSKQTLASTSSENGFCEQLLVTPTVTAQVDDDDKHANIENNEQQQQQQQKDQALENSLLTKNPIGDNDERSPNKILNQQEQLQHQHQQHEVPGRESESELGSGSERSTLQTQDHERLQAHTHQRRRASINSNSNSNNNSVGNLSDVSGKSDNEESASVAAAAAQTSTMRSVTPPGAQIRPGAGADAVTFAENAENEMNMNGSQTNMDHIAQTIDSILQSPDAKDEIVEKSPGGRYLRFSEKLGSGAYKDVYRAYDTSEGIEVAWNVVKLTGVPKSERQYIVNEVRLLEKLNHSNIISFHGSWVNRGLDQVIFVTEILSSGTLKSFINKVQVIRYKIAKRWAIQILKGLEYLHNNDPPIIHRDLKCDNIFINGTSGDLRIGDLGLSTVMSNKSKVLSVLGTPEFMAPELYNESYNEKVDIYAFGMCMLEIFTKEAPYRECSNPAQIYKKVINGVEPECLRRIRSSNATDFIRQCLGTIDENGAIVRPSASFLLDHPFLAKRDNDDSEVQVDPKPEPSTTEVQSDHQSATVYVEPTMRTNSDSDRTSGNGQSSLPSPVQHAAQTSNISSKQLPALTFPIQSTPLKQSVECKDIREADHDHLSQQQFSALAQTAEKLSFDFDTMPELESNMKPVTVLMGRNQELNASSNEQEQKPIHIETQRFLPVPPSIIPPPPSNFQRPVSESVTVVNDDDSARKKSFDSAEKRHSISSSNGSQRAPVHAKSKYSRIAAVIGDNGSPGVFTNDVLQLRMTLTVDQEEQHVQFGFHLVQDDAIQVAKEMVTELNLPSDAILEISETISSIARKARIQQSSLIHQVMPAHNNNVNDITIVPAAYVVQNSAPMDPSNGSNYGNSLEHSMESIASIPFDPQVVLSSVNDAMPQSSILPNVMPHVHVPLHQYPPPIAPRSRIKQTTNPNAPEPISLIQQPAVIQHDVATKSDSGITSTTEMSSNDMHLFQPLSMLGSTEPFSNGLSGPLLGSTFELTKEKDIEDVYEDKMNPAEVRLMEEHEKKKKRALKAFSTRMGNLQRSIEEKEAQHLQTLKKHEKEQAAIEKRLKMAEEEQEQRLQKMEAEFVQQRAMAREVGTPLFPESEETAAMTNNLETSISDLNLSSIGEQRSTGVNNPERVVKAPSPSTLSQDGSEII